MLSLNLSVFYKTAVSDISDILEWTEEKVECR